MVAYNYLNEGRSHTKVIELMSLGFTGKLLQWWNNCLTEESKEDIKHAVQKDEEGTPIFDEEDIHSMDRTTIMGADYARLSLKTQATLRSVVANLPADIQVRILKSKAMFESHDQWFEHFKLLVTTHSLVFGEDSDNTDDVFVLSKWEDYFGSSLIVYEKKHPFPSLIINYEDGTDEEDRDLSWLSRMFEYGFIRLIKLTSYNQINQFPQIIQQVVTQINSPFISIRCWSTLP